MVTFDIMLPDYETLDYELQRVSAHFTASGSHGVICGVLAMNTAVATEIWVREIIPHQPAADTLFTECEQELLELYDATQEQLNDPELAYELLLPDNDNVSLTQCVVALTQWCDGFMFGVGLASLNDDYSLPEDCTDILSDISEFTRAKVSDVVDEQDAAAYFEIVEYLRVGVMLIHEEMEPFNATSRAQ